MNTSRESISVALFNLLAQNTALAGLCKTITRKPRLWTQVNDSDKPCLILFKGGPGAENTAQTNIGLTKYRIYYNLWLYVIADATGQNPAETVLNAIADAVDAAMQAPVKGERQTLGGIVTNAFIEGGSEWAPEFDDQNVLVFWRIVVDTGI